MCMQFSGEELPMAQSKSHEVLITPAKNQCRKTVENIAEHTGKLDVSCLKGDFVKH